jgi:hypothetical protein
MSGIPVVCSTVLPHVSQDNIGYSTEQFAPKHETPPSPSPSQEYRELVPLHVGEKRWNLLKANKGIATAATVIDSNEQREAETSHQAIVIASHLLNHPADPGESISAPSSPSLVSPSTQLEPPLTGEKGSSTSIRQPGSFVQDEMTTQSKRDSSWVSDDHLDVIPGPQLSEDGKVVVVGDVTEPGGLEAGSSEVLVGKKKGKLRGLLGRTKRSKFAMAKKRENGSHDHFERPRDTTGGAAARDQTDTADPGNHQAMSTLSVSDPVDPVVGDVAIPTPVSVEDRYGLLQGSKFLEQFRDTLDVPVDWIGDRKMGKVVDG